MLLDPRSYPLWCFTVSVFPHMFIFLLSLLYWRFTFRRDRFSCHHPVQSSWNIGVCLFLLLWLFLPCPLFPFFSRQVFFYTFFTSVFTYHWTASPAVFQGHCEFYSSIYQSITLYFAIFSGSSYPLMPFSFQITITAKLRLRPSNPNLPLKLLKMAAAITYPWHQWK